MGHTTLVAYRPPVQKLSLRAKFATRFAPNMPLLHLDQYHRPRIDISFWTAPWRWCYGPRHLVWPFILRWGWKVISRCFWSAFRLPHFYLALRMLSKREWTISLIFPVFFRSFSSVLFLLSCPVVLVVYSCYKRVTPMLLAHQRSPAPPLLSRWHDILSWFTSFTSFASQWLTIF